LGRLDEDKLRKHFIFVYELFDEVLDYGYPQNFELESLKTLIQTHKKFKSAKVKDDKLSKITIQATGACPWRSSDIKYRKNEIFIDVIESVNLLFSSHDNRILRADVSGQIQMKALLSGVPECKFGLNDKLNMDKEKGSIMKAKSGSGIEIDDITFHQCVRLGRFDSDRTISFIPPDGEFELMRYRVTLSDRINIPFHIVAAVKEHSRSRLEANIRVKSDFKREMFATGVKIKIPVPKNTAVCKIFCQIGKGKYTPEAEAIIWKIKKFPGGMQFLLTAQVELSASVSLQAKAWSRPPISMEFQVPMFTASGIHVRFLKVLEPKQHYETTKWVRYVTQAGSYQIRI